MAFERESEFLVLGADAELRLRLYALRDPIDEIVAAKPTAAFDAKRGNFPIDPGFFTRLVYEGV